jgi:hypothetical protein
MAAVLKCWQDRGLYTGTTNFDPDEFLAKLKPANYEWARLKEQMAAHAWLEPSELLSSVRQRYAFLLEIRELEKQLCHDRWQKRQDIHNQVWAELQAASLQEGS